jgi:uncharacterized protein (TIGR02265 family)
MAMVKCSDVVALRKLFKDEGKETEDRFLSKLPPNLIDMYQKVMATDWVAIPDQMKIYQAAAETVFPDSDNNMRDLGKALAERTYTGVYRVFLRIPTVPFVANRAAQIWRTFYDTGNMRVENQTGKSLDLVLADFPELPKPMRAMAGGHMTLLLEMTGAKDISIQQIDADCTAWRWHVEWN